MIQKAAAYLGTYLHALSLFLSPFSKLVYSKFCEGFQVDSKISNIEKGCKLRVVEWVALIRFLLGKCHY